ncbi:MAG: autotransporter-associated beta strand repeat-containing protein [Pirellulales bacterium]
MSNRARFYAKKLAITALIAASFSADLSKSAFATALYWDSNGTTSGSGAPTGTWGTSAFWNTDSTGAAAGAFQTATTVTDDLFFSAGTNGTTGTVTVGTTQSANSITLDDNVGLTISGGTSITLGNSAGAGIFVTSTNNAANTISTALVLTGSTVFQTSGIGALTLSGAKSGTGNIVLNNNATNAAGITLSTGAIGNTGTITNSGVGTGGTLISGVIGTSVTGVVQNSATSMLTLSGANTFTSGVTVKAGTLRATNSASALGTGTVTIGDSATNLAATLDFNFGGTTTNAIVLASGVTAPLTISTPNASAPQVLSGGVTGTNDLRLSVTNVQNLQFITGAINNAGSVNNVGTGTGELLVASNIGSNVTTFVQNSTTSASVLSGTNTYDATSITSGALTFLTTSAMPNYPSPIAGKITVAAGATLAYGIGAASGQFGNADIANVFNGSTNIGFAATGGYFGLDTSASPSGSVTYAGNLTDPSLSVSLGFNKRGAGTLILTGATTYSGNTLVSGGALNSPVPLTGNLAIAASTSTSATYIPITNAFTRPLGSSAGEMQITGGQSGFTATIAGQTVTFGAVGSPTALTWGGATFAPAVLVLNDVMATNTIDFVNPINLGTATRTIGVNATVAGTAATMSGNLSGGTGGGITKTGAGTLILTGTNTFPGAIVAQAGTLTLIGSNTSNGITINAGTNTTVQITNVAAAGTGNITTSTGATTPIVQFRVDGGGTIAFPNGLGGNSGITTTLDVNNNGTGTNGVIQLNGTLANSAIGTVTYNVTGGNGYSLSVANLRSTAGTAGVTTFNPTTANLLLGNLAGSQATGTNTWTLSGSATGNTLGVVANGGAAPGAVTKTNTGTWTMTGTSTYTGATLINGGRLALTGALGNTAITVAAGGTFAPAAGRFAGPTPVAGTTGATLTLSPGGVLDLAAGTVGTFTLNQQLTFAGTAASLNGGTINFDLGGASTTDVDRFVIGAGGVGTAAMSGTNIVTLSLVGSPTGLATGSYTLVQAGSGLVNGNFLLASPNLYVGGTLYNLSLSGTATTEVLNISTGGSLVDTPNAYWAGGQSSSWVTQNVTTFNTNFVTDPGGLNNAFATPASTTNVFFSANTAANLTATLDQNFTINSLNFTGTGTGNAVGSVISSGTGANTLRINAGADNGNVAGSGITVASGAGAVTISPNVILGSTQTWTTNSTNDTAVSGVVSESASGFGLTKAGTGTLILSAANTYSGATTINGGILSVAVLASGGMPSGLGQSSSADTNLVFASGTLRYTGGSQSIDRAFSIGTASTATFDIAQAGTNLTLPGATGVVSTGALIKNGPGTLTLNGANTYNGNTTVNAGALVINGSLTGNGVAASGSTLTLTTAAGGAAAVTISGNITDYYGFNGAVTPGSVSAYNQTSGTVNYTSTATNNTTNVIAGNGGYGYFNLTGGTVGIVGRLGVTGSNVTTNGNSVGVAYIGGTGKLNASGDYILLGYNGAGNSGSLTIGPGGEVHKDAGANGIAVFWSSANLTGIINVAGGLLTTNTATSGRGLIFGGGTGATNGSGYVNLAAGTYSTGVPMTFNGGTGSNAYINSAGGTIQAFNAVTGILPVTASNVTVTATLFGAINNQAAIGNTSQNFVGGLTIDTNGFTVSTAAPLRAPTGVGVTQSDLTISGGSGYLGAPLVVFGKPAGGGVPASGYALISGGSVTGIVITAPGTYAASEVPTITLSGGGATIPATATSAALTTANISGGFTKIGVGTLTLTGASTYTGLTTISAGSLQLGTGTTGALATTGTILNNGNFAVGRTNATLQGTDFSASDISGTGSFSQVGSGTTTFNANNSYLGGTTVTAGALQIGNGGTTGYFGTGAVTLTAGTLIFNRSNTLTLAATNLVTGAGAVTLAGGTVAAAVDGQFTTTGGLNFGAANASTSTANLDLTNGGSSFGAILVRTNAAAANTVTVGAGKTFAATGLTMGYDAAGGTGATLSRLTVAGPGTMSIVNTTGTINIGTNQALVNQAYWNDSTLDVTGLGLFNVDVATLNIGVGTTTQGPGTVLLSNTSNTITATTLQAGNTGSNNGRGTGTLTFGTGTNIVKADTINIGIGKNTGPGLVNFASQVAGSSGTVTITNKAGDGGAAITVGNINGVGTAGGAIGTLDLRGHISTVTASTLLIANNNGTSTGAVTGTVSFDAGTFTAGTINIAPKSAGGNSVATGTLNVGGGNFIVNTAFTLGSQSTAGSSVATLNLTGGTLTSNVDILKGSGTVNATLNLDGGELNMMGKNLGGSVAINNLVLASGKLSNVAQINNGGAITKTTTGTLIIDGTNSYTGATAVSAGRLMVNGNNIAATGAVSVAGSATLGGTGTIGGTTTVAATGVVAPGTSPGTLTFNAGLSLSANSNYVWELFAESVANPGSDWDRIAVSGGALNVASGVNLVPTFGGATTGPTGNSFWLSDRTWTGIINVGPSASIDVGSSGTLTIDNNAWSSLGTFSTVATATGVDSEMDGQCRRGVDVDERFTHNRRITRVEKRIFRHRRQCYAR